MNFKLLSLFLAGTLLGSVGVQAQGPSSMDLEEAVGRVYANPEADQILDELKKLDGIESRNHHYYQTRGMLEHKIATEFTQSIEEFRAQFEYHSVLNTSDLEKIGVGVEGMLRGIVQVDEMGIRHLEAIEVVKLIDSISEGKHPFLDLTEGARLSDSIENVKNRYVAASGDVSLNILFDDYARGERGLLDLLKALNDPTTHNAFKAQAFHGIMMIASIGANFKNMASFKNYVQQKARAFATFRARESGSGRGESFFSVEQQWKKAREMTDQRRAELNRQLLEVETADLELVAKYAVAAEADEKRRENALSSYGRAENLEPNVKDWIIGATLGLSKTDVFEVAKRIADDIEVRVRDRGEDTGWKDRAREIVKEVRGRKGRR